MWLALLKIRSSEHLGILHLTGKQVECKQSAVSDHLLLHKHDSDFNDFTLLCQDNNGTRLLLKESILISRDSPVLNLVLNKTLHLARYHQWDFINKF